jgi:hypothetical protein
LERARKKWTRKFLEDYKIDERRQFEELQTDANDGLRALDKFFGKYKLFAAKNQFENALKTGWNQIVDLDSGNGPLRTIETLRADPVLKYRWQGPQRRPRPGHQPEPWL